MNKNINNPTRERNLVRRVGMGNDVDSVHVIDSDFSENVRVLLLRCHQPRLWEKETDRAGVCEDNGGEGA